MHFIFNPAQLLRVMKLSAINELNPCSFEPMSAGLFQVVFSDPSLVGKHRALAKPERLQAIPVAPPPYWELMDLLKAAFAP